MTLEEIQEDMIRINGEHNKIYASYESLRMACHDRHLPYYEVWYSRLSKAPRYITRDEYDLKEEKGKLVITDMENKQEYLMFYGAKP